MAESPGHGVRTTTPDVFPLAPVSAGHVKQSLFNQGAVLVHGCEWMEEPRRVNLRAWNQEIEVGH
jgi:hypothetical protein